ncbi:MAG TPA: sensor histidine kinase N-terminal domain-containing protein [Burkholderiales bacterium]|jgi:two-component system sensor histidine kinase TctE|nr:sensor histidine kinase N-terminal domain-containing protein [Burkholderiales bacterium]
MPARSLRARLLRMLLPPIAALLVLGALVAYYPSIEPATEAYDQALIDVGISLGTYIRGGDFGYRVELPVAVDQVLRRDAYDTVYYRVLGPKGEQIAGDEGLPEPSSQPREVSVSYDATYKGQKVRVVALPAKCGSALCRVLVGETMVKRNRLARDILFSTLLPEMLIALATLVIVWFGVKRGLGPLARLSDEIKARSPGDLRPIDAAGTPEEARPLVSALNDLLGQLALASRNQQRFLANAAHQLRTPLAGLQAHTELALAKSLAEPARGELEFVHEATIRTARLANQLLALARAEPGARGDAAQVDLKPLVEGEADAWVHQALARDVDLGFDLAPAKVRGDAFLLREALANLVHNGIQYTTRGGRVTVRTGQRAGQPFLEVEDDGPGIPPPERERVLERFYRMPGTPGTGSGLGLAIVREIAAGHGAAIVIGEGIAEKGSDAGKQGCRVAITFPRG